MIVHRIYCYAAGVWCVFMLCGCDSSSDQAAALGRQAPKLDVPDQTPSLELGKARFDAYCAACHQRGGTGIENQVPPLTGSPWVAGPESRLIRVVLHGLRGPIEIQGTTYNLEMPSFGLFKDAEIAAMLSYVRQRYGAPSPPITEATVKQVREATRDRKTYWTVVELLDVP